MSKSEQKQSVETKNLKLKSMIIIILGLVIMATANIALSNVWEKFDNLRLTIVITSISISNVLLAVGLWELAMKKSFADEILHIAKISDNINEQKLMHITTEFSKIDFQKLISSSKTGTIVVFYANSVFMKYESEFRQLRNLKVVIADKNDNDYLVDLVKRFGNFSNEERKKEELITKIKDSETILTRIKNNSEELELSLYILNKPILASYYLFDSYAVMTTFNHASHHSTKSYGRVFSIVCQRGGSLYKYIEAEVNDILNCSTKHMEV